MQVQKHLALLGHKVKDKVTGIEGIVATIGFDLYGCIQAIINRGVDKDGKTLDQMWLDVSRLTVLTENPVMTPPNYDFGPIAEGRQGSAERPASFHSA